MNPRYVLLGLAMGVGTLYSFLAPGAKGFRDPDLARIIFFHLPSAFCAAAFVLLIGYLGIRVIRTKDPVWDLRLAAATELGTIFALLTMATGIIFSRTQWGAWWQNDPRQVSFLVVCFMLLAATALRSAITDDQLRAKVSGAYSIAMFVPAIFLTFVYPRLESVRRKSFHPSTTIQSNEFDATYWMGIFLVFFCLLGVSYVLYRMRVRIGLLELKKINEYQPSSPRSATADGVVRPVGVHEES